jgi:hypothetical protein
MALFAGQVSAMSHQDEFLTETKARTLLGSDHFLGLLLNQKM